MSDTAGRVFTEGEHTALVDDAVRRETAADRARITELETEKSELQTTVDRLETEKAQETSRADTAEKALTDFKEGIEAEKAQEARRVERVAKVAEANPLLDLSDESELGKARQTRIAAMSDEDFESYLADMREVASKAPATEGEKPKVEGDTGSATRATAAFLPAGKKTESTTKGTVRGIFGARAGLNA